MRKGLYLPLIVVIIAMFGSFAFSDDNVDQPGKHESKNELMVKIGTGYANKPEKFGLDIAVSFYHEFDPYFAAGLETGLFWIRWDQKIGVEQVGLTTADVKTDTNAYTIPLLANAQIRFPRLLDRFRLEPSITAGLGYAIMFLGYSRPSYVEAGTGREYKKKSTLLMYGGFAWQVYASIGFRPADDSKVEFILDAGYRGMYPERENVQFNMSGFITRLGVKVYL